MNHPRCGLFLLGMFLTATPVFAQLEILHITLPLIVQEGTGNRMFFYFPPKNDSDFYIFRVRNSEIPPSPRNPDKPISGSKETTDRHFNCKSIAFIVPNFRITAIEGGGKAYITTDKTLDAITIDLQCSH